MMMLMIYSVMLEIELVLFLGGWFLDILNVAFMDTIVTKENMRKRQAVCLSELLGK